ncbi:MAG: bifunctional diguanylate cyclase/phosphodiesterase [Methylomonas sp.]|nr:bifunctional diguanylate cyclase/phosphodiesterase [Methylomonas sp.]
MKVMQARLKKHSRQPYFAAAGSIFEKTLFWHLLYDIAAFAAVFVLDPQEDFRLAFGMESLRRVMGRDNAAHRGMCISDSMAALNRPKLMKLWEEVGTNGKAILRTDLLTDSGQNIEVELTFHALDFSGRKMLVCYMNEVRRSDFVEDRLQQLRILLEKIAHGAENKSLFEQIALSVESTMPGLYCIILILNPKRNRFRIAAAPSLSGTQREILDALVSTDLSGCNTECVASALLGRRLFRDDIGSQSCGSVCQQLKVDIGAQACWSEPIFSQADRLLGVVRVYSKQIGLPAGLVLASLRQAAHLSAIVIEREAVAAKKANSKGLEPWEGSHGRQLLGLRLREAAEICRRNDLNMALLFINLDHFKEINVALGFHMGDELLVQAEIRIRNSVRDSDVVERLAGDEFVVVIPPYKGHLNAGLIGEHIVEALSKPFQLENSVAYISASIGIAHYPEDAGDIDSLLDYADQSMYAVKKAGRNGVNFFTRSLHQEVQENLQLNNDLRNALQAGQFDVYFQPIVNILSQRVDKAEALLRWHHPLRGMVSPDQFIPMAEETGVIHEIGDWVFRRAADMAMQWQSLHSGTDGFQISVNMSPLQFMHGSADALWLDHLQAIGLNPKAMVIEITEGLLLNDRVEVMNKLRAFCQAGMQLAMDDFGTGYSAMAYLKKYNVHYLKIDRSFVRDLETDSGDRAIAEAIVVMAHRLGLKVIAEGVETRGQRDLLAAVGCDYVQGYLYAKPMSADEFLMFVGMFEQQAASLERG